MKRITILLMVAALATAAQATDISSSFVNIDFDSGAVTTAPYVGFDAPYTVEIIGWTNYPSTAGLTDAGVEGPGAWWNPYETNAAFIATGTTGEGAYNTSSYVIQAGDAFVIDFWAKHWEWTGSGTGEWTITLYYDDPANVIGTYVQGSLPTNGAGWAHFTSSVIQATVASEGGNLGILIRSTGGRIVQIDEITIDRVRLLNNSPADGATMISPVRTDAENDLVFTVYDPVLGTNDVEVYLTANDPNVPTLLTTLSSPGTGTQTVTLETELGADLLFDTTYYWRAVGYEPNAVPTPHLDPVYGPVWSFTTAPEVPSFSDDPDVAYVFEGDTAGFTGVADSLSAFTSVKWFKVDTPDVEVTEADLDVTIDTTIVPTAEGYTATSTLSIANTDAADLGSYYMQASNSAGPTDSADADLIFKELIAYWPFDGDLLDATGNGWNGTTISTTTSSVLTPVFGTGEVGQAVDLEGTQTYIDLIDGLADDFRGGLTFSVWAYPRSNANWARFLSFNNGAPSDNLFFSRVGTGTTLRFDVEQGTTNVAIVDAAGAIALNVWQMFTVTMSDTGAVVLYKNGVQIATGSTSGMPNTIARTNNWIGRSAWSADALFNGLLDDIRIYNYELTPEDVATLYTSTTPEADWICVSNTDPALGTDVNDDCNINLDDVAALALWWLECERVPTEACVW